MTFQAPKVITGLDPEPNRILVAALGDVQNDLRSLTEPFDNPTPVQTGSYVAKLRDLVRAIPPAAGMNVLLPLSTTANAGEHVRIAVESVASGGAVIVNVSGGQFINGVATLTLSAVGLTDLVSLGPTDGWSAATGGGGGGGGVTDWASALAGGTTSGPHDPTILSGRFLGFGDPPSAALLSGDIRAGVLATTGVFKIQSDDDLNVEAAHVLTLQADTGDVDINAAAQAHITAANLRVDTTSDWKIGGTPGAATNVLTSNGAGTPPTWQAGGSVGPTGPTGPIGATGATGSFGSVTGPVLIGLLSGTASPAALTGAQAVQVLRYSNQLLFVAGGSNDNFDNSGDANWDSYDEILCSADTTFTGFKAPAVIGKKLALRAAASHFITLKHNTTSTTVNRIRCPGGVDYLIGADSSLYIEYQFTGSGTNPRWVVRDIAPVGFAALAPLAASFSSFFGIGGYTVSLNNAGLLPIKAAVETSGAALTFAKRTAFAAGTPGSADDVTVAVETFAYRILDVFVLTSTAIAASAVQLRDTAGGIGGAALSSALATAAAGTTRNNDSATRTVAASGTVFLRRSDRGVAGEVVMLCERS